MLYRCKIGKYKWRTCQDLWDAAQFSHYFIFFFLETFVDPLIPVSFPPFHVPANLSLSGSGILPTLLPSPITMTLGKLSAVSAARTGPIGWCWPPAPDVLCESHKGTSLSYVSPFPTLFFSFLPPGSLYTHSFHCFLFFFSPTTNLTYLPPPFSVIFYHLIHLYDVFFPLGTQKWLILLFISSPCQSCELD